MTELRLHRMTARFKGICLNRDCRAPIYVGESIVAVAGVGAFCLQCQDTFPGDWLLGLAKQRLEAE